MDLSPLLDLGLPPSSFIGYDPMSDREAAVLLNGSLAMCNSLGSVESSAFSLSSISCVFRRLCMIVEGCMMHGGYNSLA